MVDIVGGFCEKVDMRIEKKSYSHTNSINTKVFLSELVVAL